MSDCIFCRIVAGEIPSKKVFEDDRIFAFEDISPKAPTHVLVVPREHVARLSDATPAHEALLGALASRAAAIARDRGLSDFRVVVNNGEGAGQSVFHLHFHLLGGRSMTWPPG
ncbi:MAG: histidine triad nucleotide-binding protein [Acidobacteriota bacterium]|nr:histidine triad nucleotide-binding protein [Acidobacteriota bacterium]MDQ5871498.1 histidine triad nucleotide-binding protein [Acidobacteriota bacterium]